MEIEIKPGKYVVAVSGGVDSMVLLHLLASQPAVELVVAHFEHGVRADSDQDRQLVQQAAGAYGVPFVFARGHLGANAGEATARAARYRFLEQVRVEQGAQAIVTAHHQDDLLETALINMLRGTGPRGLSSLRSTETIARPLLHLSKNDLYAYARAQGIGWHEDSTNDDDRYLRNYLRHHVLPRFSAQQRAQLLAHIHKANDLRMALEAEMGPFVASDTLDRKWFISLPYAVSGEALASWLRRSGAGFDRKTIHRLVVFAKTAAAGKQADVGKTHYVQAGKTDLILKRRAGLR